MRYRNSVIAATIFLLLAAGCTCQVPISNPTNVTPTRAWITLYRRPLEIRLSKPKSLLKSGFLVVYATGDGGWRGLDTTIFDWISEWNYPVAGFSSRNYLKNLGYVRDTTTPDRLVMDFEKIIQFSEQMLDMQPSTRIILVGLSRGAGLAVVAAGEGTLKSNLAGVVAIALTKEEEHVVRYGRRERTQPGQPKRERLVIQTYEYLPRIASVPVMVIQSTHDGYLPADAARALFGPDTQTRRLLPINAKNHSFADGCPALYSGAKSALDWIQNFGQSPARSR